MSDALIGRSEYLDNRGIVRDAQGNPVRNQSRRFDPEASGCEAILGRLIGIDDDENMYWDGEDDATTSLTVGAVRGLIADICKLRDENISLRAELRARENLATP